MSEPMPKEVEEWIDKVIGDSEPKGKKAKMNKQDKEMIEMGIKGLLLVALIVGVIFCNIKGKQAWTNTELHTEAKLVRVYEAFDGSYGEQEFYGIFEFTHNGEFRSIKKNIGSQWFHTAVVGGVYNTSFNYMHDNIPHPQFKSDMNQIFWSVMYVISWFFIIWAVEWVFIIIGALIKDWWEDL